MNLRDWMLNLSGAMVFWILCVPSAHANYDKTVWGMSVTRVKALYPGGYVDKQKSGTTIYGVVRPIAGLNTAYMMFNFNTGRGLTSVTILFPAQGTEVDLKEGSFVPTTPKEAESIFFLVSATVTEKYGAHTSYSTAEAPAWLTKQNDLVFLAMAPNPGDERHSNVALSFNPVPSRKETMRGI